MTNARMLYDQGKVLRDEHPALWGVVRGRGNPVRISLLVGNTLKETIEELEELAQAGVVTLSDNGAYLLDKKHPKFEHYSTLKAFYVKLEVNLALKSEVMIQPGLLCAASERQLKEEAPEKMERVRTPRARERIENQKRPSAAQLKVLQAALSLEEGFTPLALAKAQGYTQAGWTKKYLETCERRGFVKQVPGAGRGSNWALTELGVDYATAS